MYTLKIVNMDKHAHNYKIAVSGLEGVAINGKTTVAVAAGEVSDVPLRLEIDPYLLKESNVEVEFTITAEQNNKLHAASESRFIGPRL